VRVVYFFDFWVKTLPANVRVVLEVRPSLSALAAVVAVLFVDCLAV
jgi:hypothetical protein